MNRKKYFTIKEVSETTSITPLNLRNWEKKILFLSPEKKRGIRYYKKIDIDIINFIKEEIGKGKSFIKIAKNLEINQKLKSSYKEHNEIEDVENIINRLLFKFERSKYALNLIKARVKKYGSN